MTEQRMARLHALIRATTNDDARYALGEKVRELGYLDLADFMASNPPVDHIEEIERLFE